MLTTLSRLLFGRSRYLSANESRCLQIALSGSSWQHSFIQKQVASIQGCLIAYATPSIYTITPALVANWPLNNETDTAAPPIVLSLGASRWVSFSLRFSSGGLLREITVDASRVGWLRWMFLRATICGEVSEMPVDWVAPLLVGQQRVHCIQHLLEWLGEPYSETMVSTLAEPRLRVKSPRNDGLTQVAKSIAVPDDLSRFYGITNGLSFPATPDMPSIFSCEHLWVTDDEWGGYTTLPVFIVIGGDYESGYLLCDVGSCGNCLWLRSVDGEWFRLGSIRLLLRELITIYLGQEGGSFGIAIQSGRFDKFPEFPRQ
jgi:hypothetical protein